MLIMVGFFNSDEVTTRSTEDEIEEVDRHEEVVEDEDDVEGEVEGEEEEEVEVDTEETYDLIVSPEIFDKFASIIGFAFGLMINWGSLNFLGFMIGLNYKYLLKNGSFTRIFNEIQTIIPAFMLGVLLMHLSLIYFSTSIFIGYVVRSKNLNFLDEDFLRKHSIEINVREYGGAFHELLGIFGSDSKKES